MDTSYLMPHAVCWRQDPRLIWTMVATNAITFLSYSAICLTLLSLARRTRKAIAGEWVYFAVAFALFIVACGSTHLMEVVTTWVSLFWVAAWANIITALLSCFVAIQLFRRVAIVGFSVNDYAQRLRNTEAEKLRLLESLLSSQKLEEWSRVSATVAHEISNPLAAIQNLLYLIQTSPSATPEIIAMADQAHDEVSRVSAISRSTLSFFRQSAQPESVDLLNCSESVKLLLRTTLRERNTEFVVSCAGDCKVEAYGGETRQVLLNLIRNAAEAGTAAGNRIHLVLRGESTGVSMTVEDQGTGIDPTFLPKLFQFGMSTKGDAGNGMGLWAVKHIVERHGGTVTVDSTLGKGTRFQIWWPRSCARTALPDRTTSQGEFADAVAA